MYCVSSSTNPIPPPPALCAKQRGMFSYTGIPKHVVQQLKDDHHIYMLSNGRISLAGLNMGNIERFCEALKEVLGTN